MVADTRRAFRRATDAMEPEFRKAFLQAIADVRSTAQMEIIEAAIARGNVTDVLNALRLGPEFFAPLDDVIERSFRAGGAYAISGIPKRFTTSGGGPLFIRFQGRHPRAEAWIKSASSSLITAITESQRDIVRDLIRDSVKLGQGADKAALDLVGRIGSNGRRTGGILGLNRNQAGYVRNMRDELANLDANYFNKTKRDKRFDGLVRKSFKDGKPLGQADIDRISGRYSDRLLTHRGSMIARTETVPAMNAGRREGYQQMIDTGQLPSSAVERIWDATGDARTRADHTIMEGQKAPWGSPFIAPDGSRLMGPGDSTLGASADQVIGCRCYETIRVDYLSMAT